MWCLRENEAATIKKSRKIYSNGDVQSKVGGQEEYRGADGHVRIEENSR